MKYNSNNFDIDMQTDTLTTTYAYYSQYRVTASDYGYMSKYLIIHTNKYKNVRNMRSATKREITAPNILSCCGITRCEFVDITKV